MPVITTSEGYSKTAVGLQFIVIGGSIAGLATAYALKSVGHEVLVLEASDGNVKSTGGCQSTPNMTKILYSWGLQPVLDRVALKCRKFVFRNGDKGSMIGTMTMDEDFFADLLADYLFIQHQDLKDMILDLAIREGVNIAYDALVDEIDRSGDVATVSLETGEVISADVVVVADGYDSQFRPVVTDVPDEETVDPTDKCLILNLLLPIDEIRQDEDLAPLMNPREWIIWWGSGWYSVGNLTNGGHDLAMTISYNYDGELRDGDETWTERPLEYWGIDLAAFHHQPRKIFEMAKTVSARVFCNRSLPEDLVCDRSKVVLVGDAAHPIPPGSDYHSSLNFEDAQTLSSLFGRIQHRDQISQLLSAYEEIRLPRCEWSQAFDKGFHSMMKTPAGPQQDGRDAFIGATMVHGNFDHMDEAIFRSVWGDELSNYVYDPAERVGDWWSHWGSLLMRKERKQQQQQQHQHQRQGTPGEEAASLILGLHRMSISTGVSEYHPTAVEAQ